MKAKKFIIIGVSILCIVILIILGSIFTVRKIDIVFDGTNYHVSDESILAAANIKIGSMIFNLQKDEIKKEVKAAFPDNSVYVTAIERSFPDKVTIYVKERMPLFKLKVASVDGIDYSVATDKDFQLNRRQVTADITADLIQVNGVIVQNNAFPREECLFLRYIVNFFLAQGFTEESFLHFVKDISFNYETDFKINLFCGTAFIVSKDNPDRLEILYGEFLGLTDGERIHTILK